jgi:hypothetical protein
MAKIIDIRDVPDHTAPIPGLKPPVTQSIPREKEYPEEADDFMRTIREMRREDAPTAP